MNMKVVVKESNMVRPGKETPKRILHLSSLDMLIGAPFYHTSSLFVYQYKDVPNFFDSSILKKSLADILVPFYPMAARFKTQEVENFVSLEIDCNGEGVLFVEAEVETHSLVDIGDFTPAPELKKLFLPSCDYSKGLNSFPLVMVQFTRFSCGGVILGFASNHQLSDGYGYLNMIVSWSRLTRGLDLDLKPVYDRADYLSPRNPPQVKFNHSDEYDPPKELTLGTADCDKTFTQGKFKFTKDQVDALKQKATSYEEVRNERLSTFEVLAGHIWRTACKARGLGDNQEVRLSIPTDGRAKLALPKGYCGNVVFFPTCTAKAGDITRNPLWYAALKIHETLVKVKNEEYLRSSIDYFETHPNLASVLRGPHSTRCPNMSINSWGRLPLYKADFGWGVPAFVGNAGIGREGQSFIASNPDGDGGFSLVLSLFADHMLLFETYLYDF